MKIPMQMGGGTDVTSEVFGTLPNGLSVAYPNLHKAHLCGDMLTITFTLNRTSAYGDTIPFDYIKSGYRPPQRIYSAFIGSANRTIGFLYVDPNGKMLLSFGNTNAESVYVTITYPIK